MYTIRSRSLPHFQLNGISSGIFFLRFFYYYYYLFFCPSTIRGFWYVVVVTDRNLYLTIFFFSPPYGIIVIIIHREAKTFSPRTMYFIMVSTWVFFSIVCLPLHKYRLLLIKYGHCASFN